MKGYSTFKATDAEDATLHIGGASIVPDTKFSYVGQRRLFQEEAIRLADALCSHLPQGLVDHLFAELARRQASLLIVKGKTDAER